jgi:hypothetical protein
MASPSNQPDVAVWFALGLVLALFVGTGASVLEAITKQPVATAVLTGFGTFGGTVTLVILVINLFQRGSKS